MLLDDELKEVAETLLACARGTSEEIEKIAKEFGVKRFQAAGISAFLRHHVVSNELLGMALYPGTPQLVSVDDFRPTLTKIRGRGLEVKSITGFGYYVSQSQRAILLHRLGL